MLMLYSESAIEHKTQSQGSSTSNCGGLTNEKLRKETIKPISPLKQFIIIIIIITACMAQPFLKLNSHWKPKTYFKGTSVVELPHQGLVILRKSSNLPSTLLQ